MDWEEYGLRIHIPQGTLSDDDTCEVAITALVGGGFHFPEHTELVSAIYAISLSKPLLESVDLEIQHCASLLKEEHTNCLSFVTSSLGKSTLLYEFTVEDGGCFDINNQYGSLSLKHFCLKGIVKLLPQFIKRSLGYLSSNGSTESSSTSDYFDASDYQNVTEGYLFYHIKLLNILFVVPIPISDSNSTTQLDEMTGILLYPELFILLYNKSQ